MIGAGAASRSRSCAGRDRRAPWERIIIALVPARGGCDRDALLGPTRVRLATGFGQIFGGTLHPLSRGMELVRAWFTLARGDVALCIGGARGDRVSLIRKRRATVGDDRHARAWIRSTILSFVAHKRHVIRMLVFSRTIVKLIALVTALVDMGDRAGGQRPLERLSRMRRSAAITRAVW
jgi:hypothetical protein